MRWSCHNLLKPLLRRSYPYLWLRLGIHQHGGLDDQVGYLGCAVIRLSLPAAELDVPDMGRVGTITGFPLSPSHHNVLDIV